MKKFLCFLPLALLLCIFLFSCSSDGFKEPKLKDVLGDDAEIGSTKGTVTCLVGKSPPYSCFEISESACNIIGGEQRKDKNGDIDKNYKCLKFTCEWAPKKVKYAEESVLNFDLDSTGQEGCSWKISFGSLQLRDTNYTISSSTFPGLSYSKDTNIIAEVTVTCKDQTMSQNCGQLEVKSVPSPKFTCKWYPKEVKFGGESALNFNPDSAGHKDCSWEIYSGNKKFQSNINYTISASTFPGLLSSKDTNIVVQATVTCKDQVIVSGDCEALKVTSVPGPNVRGKLSFKKSDYVSNDSNYFSIGATIDETYITNTIEITNKEEIDCGDGDISLKIDGSPAKLNTPIKATASVKCGYTDHELASISASVLPDPVIGNCELTGTSDTTMRSDETLTIGISVANDYGRCNKIEYSFSSSSGSSVYGESTSFALSSSGNKVLDSIKARVTCGTNAPVVKNCPAVSVASYIKWDECKESNRDDRDQLTFKNGKTFVEFACDSDKDDYYISCKGDQGNFSIEIDGYREGDNPDNIRPNGGDNGYNFPNLKAVQVGSLYRYPTLITVNNKTQGDIKCGIW